MLQLQNWGRVRQVQDDSEVKNQTPKVAKKEDTKKQKRGRAKKRIQYNRRFVNVVGGAGAKKLGPNSNAPKN
ncbi:hypothetical protein DYB31_002292 [Aphanomyces astaci]|uniref:40S ribosomal protein S30 n=1 Tax=Aphanomyces astaci TaxID=112090 RepID=A0A397G208_APHAT|nr:hypothetical protein DYB31_002292 [Aphanomyces astaci]